jgi:hypothetical protein
MDETAFRLGATHAADWLADVAKRMADEGKSAQKIAERLSDLRNILADWRTTEAKSARGIAQRLSVLRNVFIDRRIPDEQAIELPEGESNPWEWTEKHLDAFIAHRNKWFG